MTATAPQDRIVALDVVRGIAVAGILFANVLVFFGIFFRADLPATRADQVAAFLEHVLVEGKFYSIFSMLFGIGFGLQLARRADDAVPRFRRRLRILLAIGAIHAVLIWAGDILFLYALLGFTLPWFARKDDRSLLRWAVGLLAMPTVLYMLAFLGLVAAGGAGDSGNAGPPLPPEMMRIFESIGDGGLRESFVGNLVLLAGRWVDLLVSMRFPKVLGMFVLGLWLARRGIALDPAGHRTFLARWAVRGLLVGLPANVAAVLIDAPYLPPNGTGLLVVALQGIGYPLLAIGYAAGIAWLLTRGASALQAFAPLGRMALTNYLMHSVICVTLASGWGAGLHWKIGHATAMGIAAAIVVLQLPLSAWWLRHHRFGPVEKVWREMTYR